MVKPVVSAILSAGIAILLPFNSASAVPGLDADQAALCAAAMKIKRDEFPPGVRDALVFSKAADWFVKVGYEEAPELFGKAEADRKKRLLVEKSNGSASCTKAVNGCRNFYETSSGDL